MSASLDKLVIVRGAGDLATGTIHTLVSNGYAVIALEIPAPMSIRREVCFSEAVYDGQKTVEGITAYLAASASDALSIARSGSPAVLVDPDCGILRHCRPLALVDATIAKRNLGTCRDMAPLTIALGPGFEAGKDVDAVIETMRGETLGAVIRSGFALPNTGVPGLVGGESAGRVIHAPASGTLHALRRIADRVAQGEPVAKIETAGGDSVPVPASLTGVLRGLIRGGFPVEKGLKIADIDPRPDSGPLCFLISDKSRKIAQSVLSVIRKGV